MLANVINENKKFTKFHFNKIVYQLTDDETIRKMSPIRKITHFDKVAFIKSNRI